MTNEDQNAQAPNAYPPPPPGGMAPPPPPPQGQPGTPYPPQEPAVPYAQQPAPPYPAQPTAPAPTQPGQKKAGKGALIGIIVGLVAICGIGACVSSFLIFGGSGDKDKIKQAELHYTAAETAVGDAETAIQDAGNATTAEQTTAAIDKATKAVRTARDEIAASKAAAEQMKDSQGKSDYLASLESATQALDGVDDLVAYMNTATGMTGKIEEATKATKAAGADLTAAISAGNKNSWSRMRSEAQSAVNGYGRATVLLEEADKLDPSAGIGSWITYAKKRRQQAEIVLRMADEGRAHRYSAYNSDIKKEEALGRAAESAGIPAFISDPNWTQNRLAEIAKTATAAADKADSLRAQALKELGYSSQ